MNLILHVTSTNPRLPLSELLRQPLGLDVWEVQPDHLVLRAAEPQAERLQLYPWGYTAQPMVDPDDEDFMVTLAHQMQKLIEDVHERTYTPQQSAQLYPTAGDTTDWTYGIYQIPSLTIELRPRTIDEGGFILPPNQIQPTWEENQPAALEFIHRVL
jgi:carboxypeptidase T